MEQTQEQLDSMSVEQLEAQVAQEGAFEAPQSGENAGGEATSSGGEATQAQNEAPKQEEVPKYFREFSENMKRELGSYRGQQSNLDKMARRMEQLENALRQAQNNQNLTPEDRETQAQLQTQQEQLARFVREQARAEFGEAGKEYITLLDQIKEQRQDEGHKSSSLDLVREAIPEGADKAWNSVFEQSYKDIMEGKPGALERQARLEKDPAYVALAMIQAQRSKVQTQASQVTQNRQAQAQKAAQSVTVTGAPKAGSKPLNEMSDAELDKLSIAELEAGLPESGR